MRNEHFPLILAIFVLLTGCVTAKYENSVIINAPDNIIFNILEDYENYPNIIPDFHYSVKIISENKTGIGVQFNNVSHFGGYNIESLFEVVEYRYNEYIKLENKTQYGLTELIVRNIEDNLTEYTLINHIKMPFFMKKELFISYDNELEVLKNICENNMN